MWKQVSEDFWKENRESKVGQVEDTVREIVENVRQNGDKAIRELAKKFDHVDLDSIAVSRDEIEAAYEKAKTLVSYKTLYSPVAGTVLTKNYEEGDVIAAGAPVATLGDLTDCWVKLYIPSTQLSLVKLGAKCSVFVDPFPNKAFEATVTEINQQAEYNPRMSLTQSERANMVFWIKVSIKDTEGVIKPGMPADVTIL